MAQMMTCPNCADSVRVPDSLLGQTVKCPKCHTLFRANESREIVQPSGPVRPETNQISPQPPREPTRPCPYCAEIIPRRSLVCPFCSEVLEEPSGSSNVQIRRDCDPHRANLITVLAVLGLVGSFLSFLTCCYAPVISLFCLPFCLPALLMADHDLRRMERGEMDPEGESATRRGRRLAIISLLLCALSFFYGIAAIVFFAIDLM